MGYYYSFVLICLYVGAFCRGVVIDYEVASLSNSVENGRKTLNELTKKSNLPTEEGSCWKSALEHLEAGCKMMSNEVQTRMTFRFVSCFNEMIGLPMVMCEQSTPVKECMKQLDQQSISTFRDYFLHTQDMCYYLRQEVWQEQTNGAVTRLTTAASDVTMQMEVQKLMQEQIFENQQESMKMQSNMKKDNEDLYNTVVKVKDVFEDFSETAREHQLISTEIFDKLSKMQRLVAWIQGEMSLLDMIFYYFAAIVFGYFATATNRTRAARFWLIVLFMAGIAAEKAVYVTLMEKDFHPDEIQEYRWLIRKVAAIIGCFVVLVEGAMYRDAQAKNNDVLMHMNLTLEKVVGILTNEEGRIPNSSSVPSPLKLPSNDPDFGNTSSSSDDDSFSNYSTDDSEDNLEHELKDLAKDEENTENVRPTAAVSPLGRIFGKERNKKAASPLDRSHSYNLRERSATPYENPSIHRESPTEFARLIKRKPPKAATPASANDSRGHYFSSDDEF